MTRLEWGVGPRPYDQGVDHGVLYLANRVLPWNGLVSVNEKETGSVDTTHYFDGVRTHVTESSASYQAGITAFTYPEPFDEYNGYSERNIYERFGLSYRTQRGSGYQLHLVYNALVRDGGMSWKTTSERPDPSLFGWDIYTSDLVVPGARPSAHIVLDSNDTWIVQVIERALYGTDTTDPYLPTPAELIDIYEEAATFRVTYHADGSYTASGEDEIVELLPDGRFRINAPTAYLVDDGIFTVSSF
jgi:hypothetical protein